MNVLDDGFGPLGRHRFIKEFVIELIAKDFPNPLCGLIGRRIADVVYIHGLLKSTRPGPTFTIPQQATANRIGWGVGRLNKAITAMIDQGMLEIVWKDPTPGRQKATRYRMKI